MNMQTMSRLPTYCNGVLSEYKWQVVSYVTTIEVLNAITAPGTHLEVTLTIDPDLSSG